MGQPAKLYYECLKGIEHLRIHDLIAKTAHVSHMNTLRVLIALRAIGTQFDLTADEIVNLPYSKEKPSPLQRRDCEHVYLQMHESGCLQKYLYQVEQII